MPQDLLILRGLTGLRPYLLQVTEYKLASDVPAWFQQLLHIP